MVKSHQKKKISTQKPVRSDSHYQLRKFLEREYAAKRPLEARLIRLKPNIVFKKGTMLPNLLIKAQGKIQFLIYLDFGDQLRIYYFDQHAQSLGAENHPKEMNILKTLYGKAQTLSKLPKIDPNKGIDLLSKKIQDELTKRIKRLSKNYSLQIPSIPTISTLKKPKQMKSIRFGAIQDDKGLNVDKKYWKSTTLDFLYDREVFLSYFSLIRKNQEIFLLATFWSILKHPEAIFALENSFQSIKSTFSPIIQKFWEWLTKRVIDKKTKSISTLFSMIFPNIEQFLRFLLQFTINLNSDMLSVKFSLNTLFLYWLMRENYSSWISLNVKNPKIQHTLMKSQLLKIYIENPPVLDKYGFSLTAQNLSNEKELIWFCYEVAEWQVKLLKPDYFTTPIIFFQENKEEMDLHQDYERHFSAGELTLAKNLIPNHIFNKLSNSFHELFELYFLTQLLHIKEPNHTSMLMNNQLKWEITFENGGDWILNNIVLEIQCTPSSHADIIHVSIPNSTIFDTKSIIGFTLESKDISGKLKISIECSYDNPFIPSERSKMIFWEKELEIQK